MPNFTIEELSDAWNEDARLPGSTKVTTNETRVGLTEITMFIDTAGKKEIGQVWIPDEVFEGELSDALRDLVIFIAEGLL